MTFTRPPRIAVGPAPDVSFEEAIVRGGAVPCRLDEQPDALVWTGGPAEFPASLPQSVRWVQLPAAGVEQWLEGGADLRVTDSGGQPRLVAQAEAALRVGEQHVAGDDRAVRGDPEHDLGRASAGECLDAARQRVPGPEDLGSQPGPPLDRRTRT